MNELGSRTAAARIDIAPLSASIHAIFRGKKSGAARLRLLSRWVSVLLVLFARESKADEFEETSGAFYIGVGDQFDDDRRRVHIAR